MTQTSSTTTPVKSRICLALDGLSAERAVVLTSDLAPHLHAVKIHDLYDAEGPKIIHLLKKAGARRVWVDAKLHDTKDTVSLRAQALVRNGADIITVHAAGEIPMMRAAVEATFNRDGDILAEIYAITVLTSLDEHEIERIYGEDRTREQIVHEFALMAKEAGVKTVVCSAQEVGMLWQSLELAGMDFVVPGTRSAGVALGQQKRSGTPAQAMADGATFLVAGSQVTKAEDLVAAFKAFAEEAGMVIPDIVLSD
ncbi:orotidine-5'-phosphate decarboxylase [Candidatus Kaiserbacteria bacterium]|nr:orotidine-5'-phosphate decarboxylase [Candidatus Kaiserbacteria bacterium]